MFGHAAISLAHNSVLPGTIICLPLPRSCLLLETTPLYSM